MIRYKDIDRDSNVFAYELGPDYIRIQFKTGKVYLYTNASAGVQNIKQMKDLAELGNGLNSFIMRNVKDRYESIEKKL